MDKTIRATFQLMVLTALLTPGLAMAGTTRLYQTWAPWQADSVLAAWVIKRHIHLDAEFGMVARGTPVAADRAIDTPTSPYRRNAMRTAFEEVIRLNPVQDTACISKLRPIVRVLELAAWRKAEWPDAERFELELLRLLPKEPVDGGLGAAFEYIDQFCVTYKGDKG